MSEPTASSGLQSQSPSTEQDQLLTEWARTAEFPQPIRWGEVEDAVLDRPVASQQTNIISTFAQGITRAVGAVIVGGASVIGLIFILILRGTEDTGLRAFTGTGALFAFLIALGLVVAAAFIWWDSGRPRSLVGLALSGGSGILSAAAFIAFQGAQYSNDRNSFFIRLLTIATTVVGLGLFGAILFASKNANTQKPRRHRWSLNVGRELEYIVARNTVLNIIVERGLAHLDDTEKNRIASMPLGTWHELDRTDFVQEGK